MLWHGAMGVDFGSSGQSIFIFHSDRLLVAEGLKHHGVMPAGSYPHVTLGGRFTRSIESHLVERFREGWHEMFNWANWFYRFTMRRLSGRDGGFARRQGLAPR
jgi:hypothetical protein